MKYAMCPKCGRRLCKGENGTKVEMECPKCGEFASVIIEYYSTMVRKVFYRNKRKSGYAQTAHRRGLSGGISRYSKRNSIEKPRYPRKQKISATYMDGRVENAIVYWINGGMRERIEDMAKFCEENLAAWSY